MDHRATILLYLELLFALAILWREGLLKTRTQQVCAILLVSLAFVFRYSVMTYETLDYQDWIRVWLSALREKGAWHGLGEAIWSCNYNVPYLYFLALITKSEVYELYLVKLVSIFFDVILAWGLMRLVGVFHNSPARRLTAFIGSLWLPTVFLNGALWGQCDVIYAAFAVWGFYCALDDKPGWSVAAIAVSISFKLQGIFLLPAYLAFFIGRKIKWYHFVFFPAVYILTILPAVFAGRSLTELLLLYYNNTGSIGSGLNYNSSSLYALLDFSAMPAESAAKIGVFLAFFFCASVYVWLFLRRDEIDSRVLLGAGVLLCLGVPYLLPHMHDRYFFLADVLTFALAVVSPRMSLTPALVSFGSLLGYHAYLKMRFLLPMRDGAAAMLLALLLLLAYTVRALNRPKPDTEPAEIA